MFSCHGDFLSTRQVSVGKARLGLLGVYDRYFVIARKVSVITPPNGPIIVEHIEIPRVTQPVRRRAAEIPSCAAVYGATTNGIGSVSLSRYDPAMGWGLGGMAPHCLRHLVVAHSP